MTTSPTTYLVRDAKSVKRFVESGAQYKSSRYCQLKGEAYDAGSRLADYLGAERPSSVQELASLAFHATGIRVDVSARQRKLERKYR